MSDVPNIIFFIISCKILCKNCFNLFSYIFYNFTKIKIKSFGCPKAIRNYEKNNIWNIRRLVDESFIPATQRIILKIVGFYLYCWKGMTNPSYLRWDQAQPLGWRYWPIEGAPHRYWYCLCWSCSRRVCYLLSIQSSHDWIRRRNYDSNWDLFLLWPKFFLRWSG